MRAGLPLQKKIRNLKSLLQHRSDGGRSSMVEPQVVVLVVAGSSPVDHPIHFWILDLRFSIC